MNGSGSGFMNGEKIFVRHGMNRQAGGLPGSSGQQPLENPGTGETTHLPVNISVGNISGNSGIYLGGRIAISGFSAHSKTNNGFGDAGNANTFYHNLSYVYDSDVIDTPIDDRDVHILQQSPQAMQGVTNVGVGQLMVNTMQQNSGSFLGTTTITGMDSHEKENFGSGQVYGDWNVLYGNINTTYDSDAIDGVMNDQDNKSGIFFNL